MDSLILPMDLYAVLAITVAGTARVTAASAGHLSLLKPGVMWLLHLPVAAAWLQTLGHLAQQLALPEPPLEVATART